MRESAYKNAIAKTKIPRENLYYELTFHLKLFDNIQNEAAVQSSTISPEVKNKKI